MNFYGPTFILYELSSPFLNIHWFLDKLRLTGSRVQWYNGIMLLASFFSCRLLWGTYQSIRVYQDVWAGLHYDSTNPPYNASLEDPEKFSSDGVMRFFSGDKVPMWLAAVYLGSNIVLNTLNFYWFGKMIETVRSRFQEPRKGARGEAKALAGEVGIEGMDGGDVGEQTSTDEADNDGLPKGEKPLEGVDELAQSEDSELTNTNKSAHSGHRIASEKPEVRKRRQVNS